MTRRFLVMGGAAGAMAAGLFAWRRGGEAPPALAAELDAATPTDWRALTEAEWRARLSPEAFRVLRREGTERPFTSPLNDEKRAGVFHCAGCDLPLFDASTKYDSRTGWPSFWDYIPGNLGFKDDWKLIVMRTEYHCIRCGGHQGHVFNDGPAPTGLRYCNNGVALTFRPAGDARAPA